MARMPGATWKPLPGTSTTKISAYDIFCMHTMVGSLAGTDNYFRTSAAGTNSHFGVGGDGTIYQWVDTAYRSGANLNGNYHIISVETADMGAPFGAWSGSNVPAWTSQQVEALGRIAAWVSDTHGIPLTAIPDAKPGRRGVGYHRLGVPGYMVAGAEKWSSSTGKVCPGDRRIAQVPDVITAAHGGTQEDNDMTGSQEAVLQGILNWIVDPNIGILKQLGDVRATLNQIVGNDPDGNQQDRLGDLWEQAASDHADTLASLAALGAKTSGAVDPAALAAMIPDEIAEQVAAKLAERLAS